MATKTLTVPARSLFDIEDDYQSLLETQEGGIDPAQEEAFKADLAIALKSAIEKRERFGQFILACERRVEALKTEAKRILDQAAIYERAADRARDYGASVIESLGKDAKGKYRKLEGNTVVLSLRAGSDRVEFTDEASVPSEYKTLTISLPAWEWEAFIEACQDRIPISTGHLIKSIKKVEVHTSKTEVKKAIERGIEVPGADIKFGSPSLIVK
jgi:hypothetical protein